MTVAHSQWPMGRLIESMLVCFVLMFCPIFFLWGGLTIRDVSSSSVGEFGRGGPRFNDVGVEFIFVRLRVLRVDLVTRCGLGNSGKSPEQTGVLSMISVFQCDCLFLTRARVVVGSGADLKVHSAPMENGSMPANTENLLSNVAGATAAVFTVLPLPLPLDKAISHMVFKKVV